MAAAAGGPSCALSAVAAEALAEADDKRQPRKRRRKGRDGDGVGDGAIEPPRADGPGPQKSPRERGYGGFPSSLAVGCSGCSYKHWHAGAERPANFYPFKGAKNEFAHYAGVFNALEINFSYYRIPEEKAVVEWRSKVPRDDFVFTIKAHRYFTHTKRANVDEWFAKKWELYHSRWAKLEPHLGCILFQFPNAFKCTAVTIARLDKLGEFLKTRHPHGRFAVELRDVGWFKPEMMDVLRKWDLCLCGLDASMPETGKPSSWGNLPSGTWPATYPFDVCSWGAYMRFHGAKAPAGGSYGTARLRGWAEAAGGPEGQRRVFTFFNNDATMDDADEEDGLKGYPSAIADALRLAARRLRTAGAEAGLKEG